MTKIYEIEDQIDSIFTGFISHSRNDYPKLQMKYNSDDITIKPQQFVQIIGPMTSKPTTFIYPATHDFKDEAVGEAPSGWTTNNGASCTTKIIESLDGHKKVLELYDNNASGYCQIYRSITQSANQIVELWIAKSSIAANKDCFIELKEDASRIVYLRLQDDDLDYYTSGAWSSIKDGFITASNFFHIKIVLNDTDNTFDLYIAGDLEGQGLSYENNSTTSINKIQLSTDSGDSGYYAYIDAIGVKF